MAVESNNNNAGDTDLLPLIANPKLKPPPNVKRKQSFLTYRMILFTVCLFLLALYAMVRSYKDETKLDDIERKPPVEPVSSDPAKSTSFEDEDQHMSKDGNSNEHIVEDDSDNPAKNEDDKTASDKQNNDKNSSSDNIALSFEETFKNRLQALKVAKEDLHKNLARDFGHDTYLDLFFEDKDPTTSRARSAFCSATEENISWKRMLRKVQIKVLKGLLTIEQGLLVPFIWATGGHSAAASHGNFYNQSYTFYMERAIKEAFLAMNINFIGKNYAVGGAPSAPEVGFCVQSLFGTDFDILSWDFGMTDNADYARMEVYFYRAALGSNKPGFVAFPREAGGDRRAVMGELEKNGVASLFLDEAVSRKIMNKIPDSFGKNQEQLDAMPEYVRYFKCENQVENGDPFCGEQKFDHSDCPDRSYQTSWHPGWKWHALNGNLMALFMLELLGDALDEVQASMDAPQDLLRRLEAEEEKDHEHFLLHADLPANAKDFIQTGDQEDYIRNLIFKAPNVCHTAMLPSEIRYKGILTGSEPRDPLSFETADFPSNIAFETPNESTNVRLVGDLSERQDCKIIANMDHRDYFFISEPEGWKELIIPNDAERNTYLNGAKTLEGMIVACYAHCPWGDCPKGNIIGGLDEGKVDITVNEDPVVSLTELRPPDQRGGVGNECYILEGAQGVNFKPDSNGRLSIKVRVNEAKSYSRFGSFIVW